MVPGLSSLVTLLGPRATVDMVKGSAGICDAETASYSVNEATSNAEAKDVPL